MKINKNKLIIISLYLFISLVYTTANADIEQSYAAKKGSYPIRSHHLKANGEPQFTNRLIMESSPYLLQHAHNPVNWWSWEDAAFEEAKKLDKPILLSIGYSTCHWCHVMERESFENLQIAEFINTNFIPIKVDREQHPDIDELYLTSVQMLSGKAGWPLTAVLTPNGLPFFGGTYFPPEQFLSLLGRISETWTNRRGAITEQANRLKTSLEKINQVAGSYKSINDDVFSLAQSRIKDGFTNQVYSPGPSFPREPEMIFMLEQAIKNLDPATIQLITDRLTTLANGGIHDQLGGGFHRYSVDAEWQIPHFEKMLYNQAQLGELFARTSLISGDLKLLSITASTFDFMLETMQSPIGGFYAAIDAESEGKEGAYYLWSTNQLEGLLSKKELKFANTAFDISDQGQLDGYHILQSKKIVNDPQLAKIKSKLLAARNKRIHPNIDQKIITAWNSLSISALLTAHYATGNKTYSQAALKTAELLWKQSYDKNSGLARTLDQDVSSVEGVLEDYAYFARALIDIYDFTADSIWLSRSEEIIEQMIQRFYDENNGGFYISSKTKNLIIPLVTARDDAITSANSIAAQSLARLYKRTGKLKYRNKARSVLAAFSKQLLNKPESLSGMLLAADILNSGELKPIQYASLSRVKISSTVVGNQFNIQADIQAGWHINSYKVLEGDLIPTVLNPTRSDCATITDIRYPKDKLVSLGFQDDELLVYENQAIIVAKIKPAIDQSCNIVSAELTIQACSNDVCMAPETIKIRHLDNIK